MDDKTHTKLVQHIAEYGLFEVMPYEFYSVALPNGGYVTAPTTQELERKLRDLGLIED